MLVQLYSFVKFFIWYSAYRGLFPSWKRFCNWISMGIYSTAHASRPRATDKRSRAGKSEITGSYVASLSLSLSLTLIISFFFPLSDCSYILSFTPLSFSRPEMHRGNYACCSHGFAVSKSHSCYFDLWREQIQLSCLSNSIKFSQYNKYIINI